MSTRSDSDRAQALREIVPDRGAAAFEPEWEVETTSNEPRGGGGWTGELVSPFETDLFAGAEAASAGDDQWGPREVTDKPVDLCGPAGERSAAVPFSVEGTGELPWTGADEVDTWAREQPEKESRFATPELLDVQDTAADVAAWLKDEDEEVEDEEEETAAWEAGTSAEADATGQRSGLGQVTVGVAELLQLWDAAAELNQHIRHLVRQTLQRGGLVEPAIAPTMPERELDEERFTPRLTLCQKARVTATAEDDVQARLIEQLKLPIRSDERAKIAQRVRALVALFEGLDPAQKAKLRGRLNQPDDALARFFDCELSRGFRKRLRALLEAPPSPVPPVPSAPGPPIEPAVWPPPPEGVSWFRPTEKPRNGIRIFDGLRLPSPLPPQVPLPDLLDYARRMLAVLKVAGLTTGVVVGLAAAIKAAEELLVTFEILEVTKYLVYDAATGELDLVIPRDVSAEDLAIIGRRIARAKRAVNELKDLETKLREIQQLVERALEQLQQLKATTPAQPTAPPARLEPEPRAPEPKQRSRCKESVVLGRPLDRNAQENCRQEARDIADSVLGRRPPASEVHHRIPLQYAHLQPNLDPNRTDNLILVIDPEAKGQSKGNATSYHNRIHEIWNAHMKGLPSPTSAELERVAASVDRHIRQEFPPERLRYLSEH